MKASPFFACLAVALAPLAAGADVGQPSASAVAAVRARAPFHGKGVSETHAHPDIAPSATSVDWMWHRERGPEEWSYRLTVDHGASVEENYIRVTGTPGYAILPSGKNDLGTVVSPAVSADYAGSKPVVSFANKQTATSVAFFRGKKWGYEATYDTVTHQGVRVYTLGQFPIKELDARIKAAKACVFNGDCGD